MITLPLQITGRLCLPQPLQQRAHRAAARQAKPLQRRHLARAAGPEVSSKAGSGLQPELRSAIEQFINSHKVVLFMKGTKALPMCGFSNTVVQILNQLGVSYVTVNILEDDLLRSGLKEYSSWPTFPQLYVDGEFFGGCDIAIAAYQSGELQETLERAFNS